MSNANVPPNGDRPDSKDTTIVRAAIHPAIGIARVGNSEDEFYIGPQVLEPERRDVGFYRDATGALKREAAAFRIYGYNEAGEVVRELTSDWADVIWTVHVANRKAAWYEWDMAMDIPDAAQLKVPLRNANVKTDRNTLAIDPGPRSISGTNAAPVLCEGAFTGVPVKIGELRTDHDGRLLFLGGHGVSASPTDEPIFNPAKANPFINADDWYDDTCDGPISAVVKIEGREIPVESAWVVTAPPNYAPELKGERTMYDLLLDLYVQQGWMVAPASISFTNDVLPILRRLSGLQWVNQAFATLFGHNGQFNFEDPALVTRLSALPPPHEYDPNTETRRQIFNSFRVPAPTDGNQLAWPWIYGDAMAVPAGENPRQNASISATQQKILRYWADGDFVSDWPAKDKPETRIEDVPLADQPAMLDRAALEYCLADAFHPGCEMTWPMRHISMYRAPFRIRLRPAGQPEPDYGPTMDQATVLSEQGPLNAQGAGDITRWMGLPWQADTGFCRAGYDTKYDPFAPSFWPARVPNQVLSETDYKVVIDPEQPPKRRIEAFTSRTDWNQPLHTHASTAEQMMRMVRLFGSMGLVQTRPGVTGDPAFPATMMVATYGPDAAPDDETSLGPVAPPLLAGAAPAARVVTRSLPRGANFASHEDALSAPLPVRRARVPG